MRLQDKVIIVTGSESGIGRAIARRAVAEGARVVVHGLHADLARAVAQSLAADSAVHHVDDLRDPAAAVRIVQAAVERFGRIDGLVNNAAVSPRNSIRETDAAFFDEVMSVNARAPLLLVRAALPHLASASGCVLNIGSGNAYCGENNLLAYSMSKGALTTMTRNLGDALHREHHVRVNQINPGWVLTENEHRLQLSLGRPEDWHRRVGPDLAPAGRLITPEEIATAAVYWLGDESRPVSGSVVDLLQYPIIGRNPPKTIA